MSADDDVYHSRHIKKISCIVMRLGMYIYIRTDGQNTILAHCQCYCRCRFSCLTSTVKCMYGWESIPQGLRGRKPLKWDARCLMQAVVLLFLIFEVVRHERRGGIALEALSGAPGAVYLTLVGEETLNQRVSWPRDLPGACLPGKSLQKVLL